MLKWNKYCHSNAQGESFDQRNVYQCDCQISVRVASKWNRKFRLICLLIEVIVIGLSLLFPVIKRKPCYLIYCFKFFPRWSYWTLLLLELVELMPVESCGPCCGICDLLCDMVEPQALILSTVSRDACIIPFIISAEIAQFSIDVSSLPPL